MSVLDEVMQHMVAGKRYRAADIADGLGVSVGSVRGALTSLRRGGGSHCAAR